jgi:tetratricopeptide (TPR) repeat protein
MAVKRLEGARDDFEAALKLDPSVGPKGIFPALAKIAEERKDPRARFEAHRRWAKAAPDSAMAQNAYAWGLLTSDDPELRDKAAALPVARRAVELSKGTESAVLDTLALALFENGKIKEAVETMEKAVRQLPATMPLSRQKEYTDKLKKYREALNK